jgi:glycosyltransferase involved in cell wall biosynthesis
MRRQLEALAEQRWDHDFEVVIVDNRSTDATGEVARAFAAAHPGFRVVDAPDRAGLSHARNVGVRNTTAKAVSFCDDDDLVGDGWVAAMGNALHEHALVACRLDWRSLNDPETMLFGGFQRDGIEQMFGYPVAAGVAGWQRWLWDALGGNDESLDFTGEDFDMSIRAFRDYGVTPHFEPAAVYYIAMRPTRRSSFRQARKYGRSSVVLYGRYGRGRVDARAECRRSLRSYAWLARHVFDLRDAETGALWARRAGLRVGRLEQSVRSHTLWL